MLCRSSSEPPVSHQEGEEPLSLARGAPRTSSTQYPTQYPHSLNSGHLPCTRPQLCLRSGMQQRMKQKTHSDF